ncbi:MAG: VOC family protein [Acidobacteriota bacterium]
MLVQPYLFFEGRCTEAIEFYRSAIGAEVTMLAHYKDSPDPGMIPPGSEDKVMHANLRVGDSMMMLSDGQCQGQASFQGFSLSLSASSDAEAERLFSALAQGGNVLMPLGKTFFASSFGMLADRFGVSWMVIVDK